MIASTTISHRRRRVSESFIRASGPAAERQQACHAVQLRFDVRVRRRCARGSARLERLAGRG